MILVTGHNGFIGSHLWRALEYQHVDIEVIGMDPRGMGFKPDEVPDIIRLYGNDLEAVFHLGAISDTTCDDEDALFNTNNYLPMQLAQFCNMRNIPLIYASSASVYGNGQGPLNAYARSKATFDAWRENVRLPNAAPWYGLRFFNVYGPGEAHKGKQASMVHQLIEQARDTGWCNIFEGDAFDKFLARDFVHVDDVVSVMLWLWKNRPASGIYDVGTGVSRSFESIHIALCEQGKKHLGLRYIPFPDSLNGKYQFRTQADLSKLRAAGYDKPFLSLEEGIERMLK